MKWYIAKSRFSKNGENFIVDVVYEKMRLSCSGDDEVNTEDDLVRVAKSVRPIALKNAKVLKLEYKNAMDIKEKEDKEREDREKQESGNDSVDNFSKEELDVTPEMNRDKVKTTNNKSVVTTSNGTVIKI